MCSQAPIFRKIYLSTIGAFCRRNAGLDPGILSSAPMEVPACGAYTRDQLEAIYEVKTVHVHFLLRKNFFIVKKNVMKSQTFTCTFTLKMLKMLIRCRALAEGLKYCLYSNSNLPKRKQESHSLSRTFAGVCSTIFLI